MPALTGIRGVAAAWVMASHLDALSSDPRIGFDASSHLILSAGWSGVDLFFLLSGFVLMHAHRDQFARSPARAAPAFWRARFLRIYPLNMVVLALIGLVFLADPAFAGFYRSLAPGNFSLPAFLRTITLSTRWFEPEAGDWNQPIWSLSVELLGYVAFPAIAFYAARLRSWRMALACVTASLLLFAALQIKLGIFGENIISGRLVIVRLACEFTAGCLLYSIRLSAAARVAAYAGTITTAAALAIAACILANWLGVLPVLYALLIFGLSYERGGVVNRLLRTPSVAFLGRISFPLYVVHLNLIAWIFFMVHRRHLDRFAAAWLSVSLSLVCTLVVAWLLHRFVERPFSRLSHRSSAWSQSDAVPAGR